MVINQRQLPLPFGEPRKINRGRVETQPRCKIQYPMKNRGEDAYKKPKRCITTEIFFLNNNKTINKKILHSY